MTPPEGAHSAVSVCAIGITYRPEAEALRALVASVRPQVDALVIVDNASDPGSLALSAESGLVTAVLGQPDNVGLAAAQNLGIEWARAHAHTHVLLLDQDSIPAAGMVAGLLDALARLTKDGHAVAAVGPTFFDRRDGRDAPFVRVGFPTSEKVWGRDELYVRCDFLISSGVLIPIEVLDRVGAMDAGLFIDNVDLEWSFRVRSLGYELFGVTDARMEHRLGDDRKPLLLGRLPVVVHPPVRLYYIMRNRTLLYRMHTTPRVWIAQDLLRIPVKFLLFAVLVGPRRQNAVMMLRGLADGLRGRRGPLAGRPGGQPGGRR